MNIAEKQDNKFPLSDELIVEILLHKEVHFAGSFETMIDYYQKEGKGVSPTITVDEIQTLYDTEKRIGQNLVSLVLNDNHLKEIQKSKELYKKLSDVYESGTHTDTFPKLIADLILSEEDFPQAEIEAVVSKGKVVVPTLVELSQSEELNNPLYPGYGKAPLLALYCLGQIGDERSIYALFEQIGREDLFEEEIVLSALKAIGPRARDFLLKVLQSKPLTSDNERAAIALIHFKEDPEVAPICLKMLTDEQIRKTLPLAAYLILVCEGLEKEEDKDLFIELSKQRKNPTILQIDFDTVIKSWSKK